MESDPDDFGNGANIDKLEEMGEMGEDGSTDAAKQTLQRPGWYIFQRPTGRQREWEEEGRRTNFKQSWPDLPK